MTRSISLVACSVQLATCNVLLSDWQALSEHSEWDPMIEELVEMGFEDRSTNLEVLRKTGSVKRAVKDLVSAPKQ